MIPGDKELNQLAQQVGERLKAAGLMLASAESCTGGWVAKVCTDIPGSSNWFERGFVTYTNESKQELLGVGADTISQYGAVSEQTVLEMATGALKHSRADVALAVSGIAGPGGGTIYKPVGLVQFAWAIREGEIGHFQQIFIGDREAIRRQAVAEALNGVLRRLDD